MIHVVYATDKRVAQEKAQRPALDVKFFVDPAAQTKVVATQTHDLEVPEKVDLQDPNILYAATWDGISPWIVVLKGQISDLKMAYMGWPMVTQSEWEAAQPKQSDVDQPKP